MKIITPFFVPVTHGISPCTRVYKTFRDLFTIGRKLILRDPNVVLRLSFYRARA